MEYDDNAYSSDAILYPSAKFSHPDWPWDSDYDTQDAVNYLEKKDFDKKMSDYKDRLKYSKQADSRPLHRKGSLNRAFDECKLHNIIKRCINGELKKRN